MQNHHPQQYDQLSWRQRHPHRRFINSETLLNSVISTEGARIMILDISIFYLMTPRRRKEYVKMKLSDFTESVIEHYSLC